MGYFDADTKQWVDDGAGVPPAPTPAAPQVAAPTPAMPLPGISDAELAARAAMRPGTPAVTQAQIDKMAATGAYVPVQESRQVTGMSPQAEADIIKIDDAHREAALQQSIAAKLTANAALDNAKMQAAAAREQASAAEAKQAELDTAWQAKYDKTLAAQDPSAPGNQVDPGRLFRSPSVLGAILATIGDAFSARGAALGRTAPPQSRLTQMIDNDIRAQQLNIMQRGQMANNQLAQLSREWGSLEAGRQALKVQQLQAVDAQAKSVAAQTNDPALKASIDANTAERLAQIDAETAKLKAIYGGQMASSQQGTIMRPKAATGGGLDAGKLLALREKLRAEGREDRKLDIEATKAHGEAGDKAQGRAQQFAKDMSAIQGTQQAIQAYATALGLKKDDRGQLQAAGDNPLRGPVDTLRNMSVATSSDAANDARAKRAIAVEALGRLQSQGAISEDEAKRFEQQLSAGADAPQRIAALLQYLDTREKALRAGGGTAASQAYNKAYGRESLNKLHQYYTETPYAGK